MKGLAAAAFAGLLAAGWSPLSLPSALRPHLPVWAERWLYNPRERTEEAIGQYRKGLPDKAVGPAETALRLQPEPLTRFNAGTAHLAAGHAREASTLLEEAAKKADRTLAPRADYNLGNARLETHDFSGAVDAYKRALRLDPRDADAKYNLELALREQEKQRRSPGGGGQQGGKKSSPGQQPQGSQGSGQGGDPSSQQQQKPQQGDPQQNGQNRQGQSGAQGSPDPSRQGPLPQFRNQPEMSGREAAALLSAVENLERRQRRDEASKRARQRAAKGKDW
jgi:tetratricopeptide (TPR) repeat protein